MPYSRWTPGCCCQNGNAKSCCLIFEEIPCNIKNTLSSETVVDNTYTEENTIFYENTLDNGIRIGEWGPQCGPGNYYNAYRQDYTWETSLKIIKHEETKEMTLPEVIHSDKISPPYDFTTLFHCPVCRGSILTGIEANVCGVYVSTWLATGVYSLTDCDYILYAPAGYVKKEGQIIGYPYNSCPIESNHECFNNIIRGELRLEQNKIYLPESHTLHVSKTWYTCSFSSTYHYKYYYNWGLNNEHHDIQEGVLPYYSNFMNEEATEVYNRYEHYDGNYVYKENETGSIKLLIVYMG